MDLNLVETKMTERINYLKSELSDIRVGRANPQILNKIMVDYYGVKTPLNQVASISVPEPRQILISPWDRNMISVITREINQAEIGINPISDGNGIRLMFPELNEERRKEIASKTREQGEELKIAIRNIRRDATAEAKKEEKDSLISEDEMYGLEEKIQKLTDKYINIITELVVEKEKEIMEV